MRHELKGQPKTAYRTPPWREKELIRQIQAGNREPLGELIAHYYDEILRFCVYQIRDTADAYDLTQETFCRFLRYVDTYEHRNLRAYLYAIARNLCNDYWKAHRAIPVSGQKSGQEEASMAELSDTENGYARAEDRMLLAELLARLPDRQREVIVLRYYSGFTLAEIARILDENLSTVKSRLRLGLKKLKEYISDGGSGCG